MVLTLPVIEPVAEPANDEAAVIDQTIEALDAQQNPSPVKPGPKARTTRGDIHPSHAPKVERKYQTLFPIFFIGSVQGQILSVYRARIANPQKVLDYKNALAAGDCHLGTKMLKKSLMLKLVEMGIDTESD